MCFTDILILDWYDNIINAFAYTKDNNIFYCNLLAINNENDLKIYVALNVRYFEQQERIMSIINFKSFIDKEQELKTLLNSVKNENQSWLIGTTDLKGDVLESVKYTDDFDWNKGFFYQDFPATIAAASKIDDWWSYFKNN